MEGCMKITGMTMAILVAAYFLNFVMATIGLNKQFTSGIETLGLGPYQTLGNRHPGSAAARHLHGNAAHDDRDVPIIAPVMFALGFDPVWFGILVILLVQTGMISPPVGMTLFVVQSIRRRAASMTSSSVRCRSC